MQHDYKAALAVADEVIEYYNFLVANNKHIPTEDMLPHMLAVKYSLRIAHALMQEPSEAMVEMAAEAALNATRQYVDLPKTKLNKLHVDSKASYVREARAAIKAMRDQLLKEVGDGN